MQQYTVAYQNHYHQAMACEQVAGSVTSVRREGIQNNPFSKHLPNSGIQILYRAQGSPKAVDFTARLSSLHLSQQDMQ